MFIIFKERKTVRGPRSTNWFTTANQSSLSSLVYSFFRQPRTKFCFPILWWTFPFNIPTRFWILLIIIESLKSAGVNWYSNSWEARIGEMNYTKTTLAIFSSINYLISLKYIDQWIVGWSSRSRRSSSSSS